PATLEIGGDGPSNRGGGPKASAPHPVVTAASTITIAMLGAQNRCEGGARRASVIVEAPRQDILGRVLARHFLGSVLGSFLRLPRSSHRFVAVFALPPRFLSARGPLLSFAGLAAGRLGRRRDCRHR